ncbi:hypothetical protein GGP41_000326 [Bipolaris sorokiniana]|uniref:Uncharacterized protein n=1 Tax=Cochliobolus sativus TaxID=45130 RepID=A0A8H5ZGH0_COCSA|nr:hypothetical protein GGP41_000326 [Bipolaris sorokiniana]
MTPQHTYAILTKYASLKIFHEVMDSFSPLDYENAGIYTGALLDAYMDYKSIWKHIQITNQEFKPGTTDLVKSEPCRELLEYTEECAPALKPAIQDTASTYTSDEYPESSENPQDLQQKKDTFRPNILHYEPYSALIVGLGKARRGCRLEMTKIVREVDAVTADLSIVLQPDRIGIYLAPSIFRQSLPIKKAVQRSTPQATPAPNPTSEQLPSIYSAGDAEKTFDELKASISKHASRSKEFQLSRYLGDDLLKLGSVFFNSLDILEETWMPQSITIYFNDNSLLGNKTVYNNGREILNGDENDLEAGTVNLVAHEKVNCVNIKRHAHSLNMGGDIYIDSVVILSIVPGQHGPNINHRSIVALNLAGEVAHVREEKSPAEGWNLRGFYGSYSPGARLQQLGLVWGRAHRKEGREKKVICMQLLRKSYLGEI